MNQGLFSSQTDDWATPQTFYDALHQEFGFTLDPCATNENRKCSRWFTEQDNGLRRSWSGHTVFMNPPYGRTIGLWMKKAYQESRGGVVVVCLVPARTDTNWWHDYAMKHEIRLIRGRLKFGAQGGKLSGTAPFPSAVIVMRPPNFKLVPMRYAPYEPELNNRSNDPEPRSFAPALR